MPNVILPKMLDTDKIRNTAKHGSLYDASAHLHTSTWQISPHRTPQTALALYRIQENDSEKQETVTSTAPGTGLLHPVVP